MPSFWQVYRSRTRRGEGYIRRRHSVAVVLFQTIFPMSPKFLVLSKDGVSSCRATYIPNAEVVPIEVRYVR